MSAAQSKRSYRILMPVLAACVLGVGPTTRAAEGDLAPARPSARPLAEGAEKKESKGEKIAVDKLPKPVVDGIKKAMPGARITKANKQVDDGKTVYYLDDVKVGKKGWDVTIGEDGTILKKEECHDDD